MAEKPRPEEKSKPTTTLDKPRVESEKKTSTN